MSELSKNMTGTELIAKVESMVDDVLDSDYALQIVNDAKDEIEGMAAWEQLKREQSYSVSAGASYLAAIGVLPTRFALPLSMTEGGSYVPYRKYDFEDRQARENASFGYLIDLAAANVYLTGTNSAAKTMYFYHTQYSADLTVSTEWSFPERFHALLAYKAAEIYYASDAGEKARSWDDRWSSQYERGLGRMMAWNDQLKLADRAVRRIGNPSPKASL